MIALDVAVIMGTIRRERQTDRIAHWVCRTVDRRPDMAARLIDLRAFPLPFFDEPMPPAREGHGPVAAEFARTIAAADAFVFVTPEYNHGVPAVLKNALDHLYVEWNRKPMAVVGYGGLDGGVRAVETLRQTAVELQMVAVRTCLTFPIVQRSFPVDAEEPNDALPDRVAVALLDELSWWALLLRSARASAAPIPS